MSAKGILKQNEANALKGGDFVVNVNGKLKGSSKKKKKNRLSSFTATGVLTVAVALIAILIFSPGNIVTTAIPERLVEETDTQSADGIMSKAINFQQALKQGYIPEDTFDILKRKGVLVGYKEDGEFIETNNHDGEPLFIKIDDKIIPAKDFMNEVDQNWKLYDAFNLATYKNTAYYYDKTANEVFKKMGVSRNSCNGQDSFEDVMNNILGKGSDINVNTAALVEKTRQNETTGEMETYYELEARGDNANSGSDALSFITAVGNKNSANSEDEATLNAADALRVADTTSTGQTSSKIFVTFMEQINKMQAGDGNTSCINDTMNYLTEKKKIEIKDTETGKTIELEGSALDAPSLYSILSGEKLDTKAVKNYSTERINDLTKTLLNKQDATTSGTIASITNKTKGTIGRYIDNGASGASIDVLKNSESIIDESLVNNSFDDIQGIDLGQALARGAMETSKALSRAGGGANADAAAVRSYLKLSSEIAAMDAMVDRNTKSPFDITSKNTFLGSIIYNLAFSHRKSNMGNVATLFGDVLKSVGTSVLRLMPKSYADSAEGYLSNFGNCEHYASVNAVGTAGCSEIVTFDTSTLDDPYNNPEFIEFVENNTTLSSSGERKVNEGSVLANYIIYNNERETPLGVIDGGIIKSRQQDSSSISFESDSLELVENYLGASEEDVWFAKGGDFVNSSDNPEWQTYKYAQRYVSLARAAENLKMYTNDKTAYNDLLFFEGTENPVVAFLEDYHQLANNR
ncbi:hypothetical protein IKE98_01060 [Candidatus Saccharibacteria bacterium]|nr:hypothetical protein [Candidatus Saccharibacteria bacterium]